MTRKYNGWTNYETWNVALWMGNENGSYRHARSMAQDAWDNAEADATFTREERACFDLANQLRDEYEEAKNDILDNAKLSASVWADLLGAALSEVNWGEIAAGLIEEADKTEEPEEIEDETEEADAE